MKTSNILVGLLALVVIVFGLRQVDSGRTNALLAEERVRVLEVEREQLEAEFEEAVESYESLRDSLDLAHDSLAKIRDEAKNDALTASLSYNENLTTLRTRVEGQEGLEALLDTLELNHEKEVVAYQEQIATLEADNALLWRRVESLDSMWVREQEVNEVLRLEVAALNEESAAWRSVADKNIFKRIGGAVPYVLAGVAIGSLVQD
jgi:chromosome segregation ATPase|tara:strand:- start:1703 stop:2320 length:618 start_codon:yes stop_codon:yes gene_type:complete